MYRAKVDTKNPERPVRDKLAGMVLLATDWATISSRSLA
jgi:hypothetical protein